MLSSSGSGPPSSAEKPSCVSGVGSGLAFSGAFGARLGVEFLLQPLDFFTETLNRGILLLQVLDALIESTVLLKQGFRVGFLLRVHLLGVRLGVVGWRWVGFRDDGTERQCIGCSMAGNSIRRPVRDGRAYGARASRPGNADRCIGPPDTPSRFPPRALRAFPTPKAGACFSGLIAARRPCAWRTRSRARG